jgi:hypothetical protein
VNRSQLIPQLGARSAGLGQPAEPVQLVLNLRPSPARSAERDFGGPKFPPKSVAWRPRGRCSEKGCVFPAADSQGRCLQHQRQWFEPVFYSSHQPSSALLDRGKFGPLQLGTGEDAGAGRNYDRRRLAAQRQTFLGEQH